MNKKKWVNGCHSAVKVGYKCLTAMNGVQFELNDIKSLYTENDSERICSVSL